MRPRQRQGLAGFTAIAVPGDPDDPVEREAAALATLAVTQRHVFETLLHELRGPLNNLTIAVELWERFAAREVNRASPPTSLHQLLAGVRAEVARIERTTSDLGALIDPNAGSIEVVDAGAFLEQCVALVRMSAQFRDLEVIVRRPAIAIATAADARHLRTAIVAVASNLIERAQHGARIDVSADLVPEATGGEIAFVFQTVIDTTGGAWPHPATAAKLLAARRLIGGMGGQWASTPADASDVRIEMRLPTVAGPRS